MATCEGVGQVKSHLRGQHPKAQCLREGLRVRPEATALHEGPLCGG